MPSRRRRGSRSIPEIDGRPQSSTITSAVVPSATELSMLWPSAKLWTANPRSVNSPDAASRKSSSSSTRMRRMRSSAAPSTRAWLGAGPEAGQAVASSFIGVVIALHLVRKGSKLPRLHIGIELHVEAAAPIPVVPGLAGGAFLHAGRRAEHRPHLAFALTHEIDRRGGNGRRLLRGDRKVFRLGGIGWFGVGARWRRPGRRGRRGGRACGGGIAVDQTVEIALRVLRQFTAR